ncbi:S41 family peptidase [Fibrella aestuarina]|uniref:S41 family peptidase n=1 Tax=Fibrella aestuarina TaxID=651143 RepID=UPI0011D24231|nr:S41 family peptidase [Fibrella aestuarina]
MRRLFIPNRLAAKQTGITFGTLFYLLTVIASLLRTGLFVGLVGLLASCFNSRPQPVFPFTPVTQTYSVAQLQTDFRLMRRALEEAHPGLYRYHPRDSVSQWFDAAYAQLTKPMTELQFRRVIEPVVDRIGCGHTDLYASKSFTAYRKKHPLRPFPVDVAVLNDRLYVRENRSTDSTIQRGSEILAIDGHPAQPLLNQFYRYISSDGYNQTFKSYVLNTGSFGSYYALVCGIDSAARRLTFRDTTGTIRTLTFRTRPDKLPPRLDSLDKRNVPASSPRKKPKPDKAPDEQRQFWLSERDSSVAVMKVSSFSGFGQRLFFRQSFEAIAANKAIKTLIIDLRGNLGGNSGTSLRLASYLIDKPFQAYTQVDAPVRNVSFNRYLGWKFWRFWLRNFFTRRTPEGTYRRTGTTSPIKPIRHGGFRGRVFLLINGGTFSAASIFASLVKHNSADRVTVVGRETGGGAYGCNAFTSPYLTLPQTGVQLRLPLYKIVLAIPGQDQGHGVLPDVPVAYTVPAILSGQDLDIEKVYELLR